MVGAGLRVVGHSEPFVTLWGLVAVSALVAQFNERRCVFFCRGGAFPSSETDEFDTHGVPSCWPFRSFHMEHTPTVAIAIAIAAKNYLVVIRIESRNLGLFQ